MHYLVVAIVALFVSLYGGSAEAQELSLPPIAGPIDLPEPPILGWPLCYRRCLINCRNSCQFSPSPALCRARCPIRCRRFCFPRPPLCERWPQLCAVIEIDPIPGPIPDPLALEEIPEILEGELLQ